MIGQDVPEKAHTSGKGISRRTTLSTLAMAFAYGCLMPNRRPSQNRIPSTRDSPYANGHEPREARRLLERIERGTVREHLESGDAIYHVPVYHPNARGLDGFRILHLSDLHFSEDYDGKKIERMGSVLATIGRAQGVRGYDLVVVTGDIVEHAGNRLTRQHRRFFEDIPGEHKYITFGNHDLRRAGGRAVSRESLRCELANIGYADLTNRRAQIAHGGRHVELVGLDDALFGTPDPRALLGIDPSAFTIAAMHSLDALTAGVSPVIDLALWGHLHAGEFHIGIVNGVTEVKLRGIFKNLNGHTGLDSPFKFITGRTLSYANQGVYSHSQRLGLPRIMTRTQGATVLTLYDAARAGNFK